MAEQQLPLVAQGDDCATILFYHLGNKGWLSKAKEDPKFLFNSMGEARKAFEFLIDSQG